MWFLSNALVVLRRNNREISVKWRRPTLPREANVLTSAGTRVVSLLLSRYGGGDYGDGCSKSAMMIIDGDYYDDDDDDDDYDYNDDDCDEQERSVP